MGSNEGYWLQEVPNQTSWNHSKYFFLSLCLFLSVCYLPCTFSTLLIYLAPKSRLETWAKSTSLDLEDATKAVEKVSLLSAPSNSILRLEKFGSRWCHPLLDMPTAITGPPRQAMQARLRPCLDLGFQYALIRNNWSKIFGVEYWTLPGSNSPERPWFR